MQTVSDFERYCTAAGLRKEHGLILVSGESDFAAIKGLVEEGMVWFSVTKFTPDRDPELFEVILDDNDAGFDIRVCLESMGGYEEDNWQHCFVDNGCYRIVAHFVEVTQDLRDKLAQTWLQQAAVAVQASDILQVVPDFAGIIHGHIDRLAQVVVQAAEVFEDKGVAAKWMASPNATLGGVTPLSLCETELGAQQVRRVLHSIEWGHVA